MFRHAGKFELSKELLMGGLGRRGRSDSPDSSNHISRRLRTSSPLSALDASTSSMQSDDEAALFKGHASQCCSALSLHQELSSSLWRPWQANHQCFEEPNFHVESANARFSGSHSSSPSRKRVCRLDLREREHSWDRDHHKESIDDYSQQLRHLQTSQAWSAEQMLLQRVPSLMSSDVFCFAHALIAALTAHTTSSRESSIESYRSLSAIVREFCTRRDYMGSLAQEHILALLKVSLLSMLRHAQQPNTVGYQDFVGAMCLSCGALLEYIDPLVVCKVALALDLDENAASCWLVAFAFKFLSVAMSTIQDESADILSFHLACAGRAHVSMASAVDTCRRAEATLKQVALIAPDLANIKADIRIRSQAASTALVSMEALASRTERAARWARLRLPTPATRARQRAATTTAKVVARMRGVVSEWAVAEARLEKLEIQAQQSVVDSKLLILQCQRQMEESAMLERSVMLESAATAAARSEEKALGKACQRVCLGARSLVVASSSRWLHGHGCKKPCTLDQNMYLFCDWANSASATLGTLQCTTETFCALIRSDSFFEISPILFTFLEPMRGSCMQFMNSVAANRGTKVERS